MAGKRELLRLIWLIAVCGMIVYLALFIVYNVRWRCLLNEMECVLYEDSTEVSADLLAARLNSSCSERATRRGMNQRVISFSFYGPETTSRKYYEGIVKNAILISEYYPGWIMRIYCNKSLLPYMVQIQEQYSHVDFCLVDDIENHGNLGEIFGMLWRFLPMGDPLVDVFMSRDLDSVITQRELAAVNEWLNSNKTFHIMRDHPQHNIEMLGGMWGAQVSRKLHDLQGLLAKMLNRGNRKNFTRGLDQLLLREFVWHHADGDCVLHDSYFCNISYLKYKCWQPWPTERKQFQFVGASEPNQTVNVICPESCRKHKNWTYC